MKLRNYLDEIKLKLTGNLLELEIDEPTLASIMTASLRELQRYYSITKFITIPFSNCIDMTEYKVNAVTHVYRASSSGADVTSETVSDPMLLAQYQVLSGLGTTLYYQNYMYNYLAYSAMQQTRNTLSTDLVFTYDKASEKLYINVSSGTPLYITIEYVPILLSVEEIVSDYWIDILIKLAVAQTKIIAGRIRSRYTETGALWQQDGDTILNEGINEYNGIIEHLLNNEMLSYPLD